MGLSPTIRFLDFSPDRDPLTPGVLVDMDGLYGTMKGLRTLPAFVSPMQPVEPLPDPSHGSYSSELVSGDRITIAGTATTLYVLAAGMWVPDATGTVFNAVTTRWRYTTFGNYTIATNAVDPPQYKNGVNPFIPLPGAPLASIAEVSDFGYAWLVGTDSNANVVHGSPDVLDWVNNIATGVFTVTLTATSGPITGFHRIRGGVVAYKEKSLFFGAFVGPPFFWSFSAISEQVGCANNEGIVNADDVHYFISHDDFWKFDGSSLTRVPNALQEWLFNIRTGDLDHFNQDKVQGRYDRPNDLVVWHYPSKAANPLGTLDAWLALNIRTGKWTKGRMVVQDIVQPNIPAISELTYAEFERIYGIYNNPALDGLPYGSPSLSISGLDVAAVFDVNNVLLTQTGPPASAFLKTGEYSDGHTVLLVKELRPIFAAYPADPAALTLLRSYKSMINGKPVFVTKPPATLNRDGTFDFTQTSRSHQFQLELTQEAEITGLQLDAVEMGTQ